MPPLDTKHAVKLQLHTCVHVEVVSHRVRNNSGPFYRDFWAFMAGLLQGFGSSGIGPFGVCPHRGNSIKVVW